MSDDYADGEPTWIDQLLEAAAPLCLVAPPLAVGGFIFVEVGPLAAIPAAFIALLFGLTLSVFPIDALGTREARRNGE